MRPLAQFLRGWGASSAPTQVAAPTLAIVDNADGTGAVATIAGATAGTTNTIYGADWSAKLEGAAWTSLGSRSGNGTVALAVANGYHWAYVSSTDGSTSNVSEVEGYRTTSGASAYFTQILEATVATLQAMTFSGITGSNIVVRKVPHPRQVNTGTCILVTPTAEQYGDSTNLRDYVRYGILVAIMQPSNQDITSAATIGRILKWREQISMALRNMRLAGISTLTGLQTIEPGPPIVNPAWAVGWDVSALTLRVGNRESRGVT